MEDLVTNAERYKSELSSVTVLYEKLKDDTESERAKFEQLQKSKSELDQKYSDLYKSNERSKINLKHKNESLTKMVLDNIRQTKSELAEMKNDREKMIADWEKSKAAFVEKISVQHYYRVKNSTVEVTDRYELKLKSREYKPLRLLYSGTPGFPSYSHFFFFRILAPLFLSK